MDGLQQADNQAPQKEPQTAEEFSETPKGRLENILRRLNGSDIKANKPAQTALYKNAADLYKSITGEDLMEKAAEAAKIEAESEGFVMSQNNGAISEENLKKEVEGFKFKQQGDAAQKAWSIITEEEKKQFGGDINAFVSQMEKKAQGMKKYGLDISKEVFYNMTASGYMLFNAKNNVITGRIRIPVLFFSGAYKFKTISRKDLADMALVMQNFFDLTARQAVEDKLNRKMSGGKIRWRKRKLRKARELLADLDKKIEANGNIEEEKAKITKTLEEEIRAKIQKQVESEAREALEKITGIGEIGVMRRLKDFEDLEKETDKNLKKDIKDVERRLEKDIKARAKEGKKISSVIKKQVKRGKIVKKRVDYIKKESQLDNQQESGNVKASQQDE